VIEANRFLELLMSPFADSASLHGPGKLLDSRVGRQVAEITFPRAGSPDVLWVPRMALDLLNRFIKVAKDPSLPENPDGATFPYAISVFHVCPWQQATLSGEGAWLFGLSRAVQLIMWSPALGNSRWSGSSEPSRFTSGAFLSAFATNRQTKH